MPVKLPVLKAPFGGLGFPFLLGPSEFGAVLRRLGLGLAACHGFARTPKIDDLAHFKPRQAASFPRESPPRFPRSRPQITLLRSRNADATQ